MKLVASVMVGENEIDRYWPSVLFSLLGFCDDIRIRVEGHGIDASTDRVAAMVAQPGSFFKHEGRARQELLDFTLKAKPTHILAIDADEFVSDGQALRKACEKTAAPHLSLVMEEIWEACDDTLCVREDGGWRSHPLGCVWRVDPRRTYRMRDAALACGRVPVGVGHTRGAKTGVEILHFGWANRKDRRERYDRYVKHDGGKFHASAHLNSIMLPDHRVECRARKWPAGLEPWRQQILERAQR